MLTKDTLADAVAECKRFLKRAEQFGKDTEMVMVDNPSFDGRVDVRRWIYEERKCTSGKTAAAIKRASMDVTRAMAELRRP